MFKSKYSEKSRTFVHKVMYHFVGVLLTLTMLSAWMLSGLYAKYVVSVSHQDSAQVAAFGVEIEVIEHKAVLISDADKAVQCDSVYELNKEEVQDNIYSEVLPGVDIPKDPFIRITGKANVPCELYVKAVVKDLPDTVKYEMADGWEFFDSEILQSGGTAYTYKYNKVIDSTFGGTVYVIKDNKLEVLESYVGNGNTFTLTFNAWLVQKNSN